MKGCKVEFLHFLGMILHDMMRVLAVKCSILFSFLDRLISSSLSISHLFIKTTHRNPSSP